MIESQNILPHRIFYEHELALRSKGKDLSKKRKIKIVSF